MVRKTYSEKIDLIMKSREAALSAIQIYNNPLTQFKTESFIVLFVIAWTYLLHAYYKSEKVDSRYYTRPNKNKKFKYNTDGSIKYWDLTKCMKGTKSPLDNDTSNNLKFLIGLRNQIEHEKAQELDSYFFPNYQACALNFNFYLKKLHGEKYSLDNHLALSLQFAEFDHTQADVIKDKEKLIPKTVQSYIAKFNSTLSEAEINHDRFSYRLFFDRVGAKRKGQADRVIEFIDPKSPLAKDIPEEYRVKHEVEKPKFLPTCVFKKIQKRGFKNFGIHKHTQFWQKHDGKNPNKGFGTTVAKQWYWYENWIDFILTELRKEK